MAIQRSEVDDDELPVFVDTNLNTHVLLAISPSHTISFLKQKILLEHPKCFPNIGEIIINALKVEKKGCYYHLPDSMSVKTALKGLENNSFLFADLSTQILHMLTPSSGHAVITKTLPTLITSSKPLESRINSIEAYHSGDLSDMRMVLGLEMPNEIVSVVHDEFKSEEETMSPENLGESNNKNNDTKKKRKRTQEYDGNGDENGEGPEDLPSNRVGKDGRKSTNNVADEVSPSARAKKKHKVVNNNAAHVTLSINNTDMQKYPPGDADDLPSIKDSKDIKKRKKEKKHTSSKLPSPKINKPDVQEGTQPHYQPEETKTSSDKLVTEIDNVGLAPGSRAKKTKKAKKSEETPDILENGNAPTQNKDTIHTLEDSVIGSMELVTKAKKVKVKKKKGKVSIKENTDLLSMEKNKDAATCILSTGHVENDKNGDFNNKADRDDSTLQNDKKINRVKTVSLFSQDDNKQADDARESNKPSVSLEMQGEKVKRKSKKKNNVPSKDSPDFSVKERSVEKTTDTDTLKADDLNPLVEGDLYKDTNKIPLPEISMGLSEVRKTEQHASKKMVDKHDIPSSVDTLGSEHNTVSSKENRRSRRTSRDVTKLYDDDLEAIATEALQPPSVDKAKENVENVSDKSKENRSRTYHDVTALNDYPKPLGTEALQPPSIDKAEENVENTSDKSKKKTAKKQNSVKDSPPKSPMKEQCDKETSETGMPKTVEVSLVDDCNAKVVEILPSESAGLRELRNQDKPHTSEQVVMKLNLPSSSVDTSSNSSIKSKKSKKDERTSENGIQIKESITAQKQDLPMPQPSEKPSGTFKEVIETQEPDADPIEFVAKLAENDTIIGSANRKTHQGKKTKPVENSAGSTRLTRKKMGEVLNSGSPQKKGLLAAPGGIFADESSSSSDDGYKMDGSDCSTRTPSDNISSSDYSEGESKGNVVTSQHESLKNGGQDGANSNSVDYKNLALRSVLRSSSRYKKAKVLASQIELEDSEAAVEVVPDSQANL